MLSRWLFILFLATACCPSQTPGQVPEPPESGRDIFGPIGWSTGGVSIGGGGGAPAFPLADHLWLLDTGSGQQATDTGTAAVKVHLQLGSTSGADGSDPTWTARGLDFVGILGDGTDYLDGGSNFDTDWRAVANDSFSISFALRFDGLGSVPTIFSKAERSTPFEGYSFRMRSTPRIEWTVAEPNGVSGISVHETTFPVTGGLWHHYVLTYSGGGNVASTKMYIDSVLVAWSTTLFDNLTLAAQSPAAFRIGSTELSLGFDGEMGVIRRWNGTVIDAAAVLAVRNADAVIMDVRSITMEAVP